MSKQRTKSLFDEMDNTVNPTTGLTDEKQSKATVKDTIEPPEKRKSLFDQMDKGTETTSKEFKAKQGKSTVEAVQFNPEPYRDYISNPRADDESLKIRQALTQPWQDQAVNSVKQLGAGLVGGASMALGTTLDVAQSINTINGVEQEYDNALYNFGKELLTETQQENQIHQLEPGSVNPSDSGWWYQMIGDTGLSLGIAAESLAETALVSWLTAGTGTAGAVANNVRKVSSLKKLFSLGSNSKKLKAATFGMIRRHHEGIIEAADVYEDRYNYYVDQGMALADASKNAADGAALTYRANLPLMVLDMVGYGLMTHNPVSGKGIDIIDKALGKIKNPFLRGATKLGALSVSEGGEEFWQAVASEEGKYKADVTAGIQKDDTSFSTRFSEYASKGETWNAAISGMFGATGMSGMGKAYNKMTEGRNPHVRMHKDFINNMSGVGLELADKIHEADAKGDPGLSNSLRRQMGMHKALTSIHLDNLTEKDTAFSSYTSYLESVLEASNTGNEEELKKLGITDTDFINEAFPQYLADARKIEEIYDNVKGAVDKDSIISTTYRSFVLDTLNEDAPVIDNDIETVKASIPDYGNLTDTGKEKFELQYQLSSIQNERNRIGNLKEEFGYTDNLKEVSQTLTQKERDVKQRIKELEKTEDITDKERASDDKIMAAIPLQPKLSKLLDHREQIENEKELLRKDLTLWKQEGFQKETAENKRNKEIGKANTVSELNNMENTLKQEEKLDDKTKENIDNKKENIVINEVADSVKQTKKSPFGKTILNPGTDDFNAVRKDAVGKIDEVSGNIIDDSGKDFTLVNDDDLFEPNELREDIPANIQEKLRANVKQYHDSLSEDLNRAPEFQEFVRDYIKHSSRENADNYFNALVKGWELNGYAPADYVGIYNSIFKNREEIGSSLTSIMDNVVTNEQQLKTRTEQTTAPIEQKESTPTTFDSNNAPVYEHQTFTTSETEPKLAFNSRLTRQVRTEDAEGTVSVDYEYTTDELNEGEYVNNIKLLNPDKYLPGTILKAEIPSNYEEIVVPVYNADGTKGQAISFGDWERRNNIEKGSPEWLAKVPMILNDSDGEGVAFVHDLDWYHPSRFIETDEGQIKEAVDKTNHIRKSVYDAKASVDMVITSKRGGTFEGLKIPRDQPTISIKEANPEASIVAARSDGQLYAGSNTPFKGVLENTTDFNSGAIYDVRRTGTNEDGQKTYTAFPVMQEKISTEVQESVLWVIQAHMNKVNTQHITDEKKAVYDGIRDKILTLSGLDIYDVQDFESYLNLFIPTIKAPNAKSEQDIKDAAEAKLPHGAPYIGIQRGNIVIGRKGFDMSKNNAFYYIYPNMLKGDKPNIGFITSIFTKLKEDLLPIYSLNASLKGLETNKPVPLVNADGGVDIASSTYDDFLKSNFKTNIKSHNIGTEDKPVWISKIQPVITFNKADETQEQTNDIIEEEKVEEPVSKKEYDEFIDKGIVTDDRLNSIVDKMKINAALSPREIEIFTDKTSEINEKLAESPIQPVIVQEESLFTQEEVDDLLDKANEDLKWIDNDEESFYQPVDITDEQVKEIISGVVRIPGIHPLHQYHLVDYVFNNISTNLSFNKGSKISKEELSKELKASFDAIVGPVQDSYKERRDKLQTIYDSNPEAYPNLVSVIEGYSKALNKIDIINTNFKVIQKDAMQKVRKYTGIVETKNDDIQDTDNDREKNYSKTSLEENGKDTSSYRLKRFFAGVKSKKVAPNGTISDDTSFLNLPTYIGFDKVYNTLSSMLAEVPADFNTMIAKIEEEKDSHAWLPSVIAKLQDADKQIQNEFVSTMNKHSLNMEFVMYAHDEKRDAYNLKVYNTNSNAITQLIQDSWYNNFKASNLTTSSDGVYILNKERAQYLLDTYNSWGGSEKLIPATSVIKGLSTIPTGNTKVTINITNAKMIKSIGEGGITKFKKDYYKIEKVGNKEYSISLHDRLKVTPTELQDWLAEFGIEVSEETINEIMTKGMWHNRKLVKFPQMFQTGTSNGLFGILGQKLNDYISFDRDIEVEKEGNNPLSDSVLKSLAKIEGKYATNTITNSFRDNGKSIYGFTPSKFITDRVRDLKSNDEIVDQLDTISFSKNSLWGDLLKQEDGFKEKFGIIHLGLNAIKELGKKLYRDNELQSLSDSDHELTKLGFFQNYEQGMISTTVNGIEMRMGRMFSPTMSDKSTMTILKTGILDLKEKHFIPGDDRMVMKEELKETLFEQLVVPELERMVNFHKNIKKTNIKSYDEGASMFYFIPAMNEIKTKEGVTLVNAIKERPDAFDVDYVRNNMKADIFELLQSTVEHLAKQKEKVWEESGFIVTDPKTGERKTKFFDNKYLKKLGSEENSISLAANDYVINSLVANANSFMTIAGDPAMYHKAKADTSNIEKVKETFINVGKRLANQIAPGIKLADSDNNNSEYYQVFIEDKLSVSKNIKYLEKLLGKEAAAPYRNIEGTDAQEYTTWKEHLYVLEKMGKTPDFVMDITPEEIREARQIASSSTKLSALNDRQREIFNKVFQPIKPVYTGQVFDEAQDVMRTVYIKSSSFPLLPQLTEGLELNKLRKSLEALEKKTGKTVRASYQSANKVGALTNPVNMFEGDTINKDSLKNIIDSSLVLKRKNFRIQQDVPFKSAKRNEDTISLGTQTTKLLFGNGVLDLDGFIYNGKEMDGVTLFEHYNNTFKNLIDFKTKELYNELGIDQKTGFPIDVKTSMVKLQNLLKTEAEKRGYPKQDIEALGITHKTTPEGNIVDVQFNLPLWISANSNRYEALLNAIVTNRIAKIKMPGNSYVAGSEEGFRVQDDLEGVDKNKIIFTSAWTGELEPANIVDGKLKKTQVLLPSKFRNEEGDLIDLFIKENNEYVYVAQDENGSWRLKEDMIDSDLLSMTSFRIPTSSHVSMAEIEIVGFLPYESGDLIIVPRNLTTQKGLDFDIDKENLYQLWSFIDGDNKIQKIEAKLEEDENLDEVIEDTEAFIEKIKKENSIIRDAINEQEEELDFVESYEDARRVDVKSIKAKLKNLRESLNHGTYSKQSIRDELKVFKDLKRLKEKLLQNEIVKIHSSVLSNPSDAMQKKINGVLSTEYAEQQADLISGIVDTTSEGFFTPLSDEYQKEKVFLGASGKTGTGAYSLDVTGHSIFQQVRKTAHGLGLTKIVQAGTQSFKVAKSFRFGKQQSNGSLGNSKTIDGSRTITEVLTERQNISVDNEKLQVMGRVGLNSLTLDVDKTLTLLGFDKGEDGNSISFLFLSQPIIKDYVIAMQNANSNTSEYSANKEMKVISDLAEKYPSSFYEADNLDKNKEIGDDLLDNKNLVENLKGNVDNFAQNAILERFLELKEYGEAIRGVQTTINIDSKGLGKSLMEVIEKENKIKSLPHIPLLNNAEQVIGNFIDVREQGFTKDMVEDYLNEGYTLMGDKLIKPTTIPGMFAMNTVKTADQLWMRHFPYYTTTVQTVTNEILSATVGTDASDQKLVETRQHIFKEIKKYIHSNVKLNLYNESPQVERQRLFIDTKDNQSLASYVKEIKSVKDNSIIDNRIKKNNLLNRFEFNINSNGEPSLIKFNTSASENFDEEYLYNSLLELIEKEHPLPAFNGAEYNTRKLAQDLIAYSYLEGGVQEAIQFVKYVPVSYLNTIGYADNIRNLNLNIHNIFGITSLEEGGGPSRFTMQYAQHNPHRMPKLNEEDIKTLVNTNDNYKKGALSTLESFEIPEDLTPKQFYAVYNSDIKKGNKFQLYYYQGNKYVRVPTLGTFGMVEYDLKKDSYDSIINLKSNKVIAKQKTIIKDKVKPTAGGQFKIEEGNIENSISQIANHEFKNNPELKALATNILPYIDGTVSLKVGDLVNDKGQRIARGRYRTSEHAVHIDKVYLSNGKPEDIAKTLLHETIHSMTVKELDKYLDKDGNYLPDVTPPKHIVNLVRLYKEVVNNSHLSGEIKKYQEKRKLQVSGKTTEGTTTRERTVAYGGYNIREFVTMVMSEPAFQKELADIKYKTSGQSMLDKFMDVIKDMLVSIGVQFDSDSIAAQSIKSVFDIFETTNVKEKPNNFTKFAEVKNSEEQGIVEEVDKELQTEMFPSMPKTKTVFDYNSGELEIMQDHLYKERMVKEAHYLTEAQYNEEDLTFKKGSNKITWDNVNEYFNKPDYVVDYKGGDFEIFNNDAAFDINISKGVDISYYNISELINDTTDEFYSKEEREAFKKEIHRVAKAAGLIIKSKTKSTPLGTMRKPDDEGTGDFLEPWVEEENKTKCPF